MPISESFSAHGKLGLASSVRKYSDNQGLRTRDKDKGAYAALGFQYQLNPNVALVGEYERYGKNKMSGAKADAWTAGIKFGF